MLILAILWPSILCSFIFIKLGFLIFSSKLKCYFLRKTDPNDLIESGRLATQSPTPCHISRVVLCISHFLRWSLSSIFHLLQQKIPHVPFSRFLTSILCLYPDTTVARMILLKYVNYYILLLKVLKVLLPHSEWNTKSLPSSVSESLSLYSPQLTLLQSPLLEQASGLCPRNSSAWNSSCLDILTPHFFTSLKSQQIIIPGCLKY